MLLGSTSVKAAGKKLVKLTTGVNYTTNILPSAFIRAVLKSAKKYIQALFALLGSACVEAAHKMLVKFSTLARLEE